MSWTLLNASLEQLAGKIITFYSYKGGTGRTMALSNVAWILASNGHNVLLIDWDLEAPGLHRFLRPFLVDPELSSTPGLIDFLWDSARVSMTPAQVEGTSEPAEFPSLEDYVVGLAWDFHGGGSIGFIPAGRQDENYAQRVNTFNWDNFYERLGGGKQLQAERDALRAIYDYILIDSRTGVSDTSSICTVQMPDLLVVFFTLNRQSIRGASAVAASVRSQRGDAFRIYPVPTRIENGEQDKLVAAIAFARRVFAEFLIHVQSNRRKVDLSQQASYWRDVETPYVTFYAFEEVPAPFHDESGSRIGVLTPNERLCYWITDGVVSSLKPESDDIRKKVVEQYAFADEKITQSLPDWPARPSGFVRRAIENVRVWLTWEHTAISVAVLTLLGVGAQLISDGRHISRLTSEISALTSTIDDANSQLSQIQSVSKQKPSDPASERDNILQGIARIQGSLSNALRLQQTSGQVAPSSSSENQSLVPASPPAH